MMMLMMGFLPSTKMIECDERGSLKSSILSYNSFIYFNSDFFFVFAYLFFHYLISPLQIRSPYFDY